MLDRFTATYRIETAHPLGAVADAMAGEQSSGTLRRTVEVFEDDE